MLCLDNSPSWYGQGAALSSLLILHLACLGYYLLGWVPIYVMAANVFLSIGLVEPICGVFHVKRTDHFFILAEQGVVFPASMLRHGTTYIWIH